MGEGDNERKIVSCKERDRQARGTILKLVGGKNGKNKNNSDC